MSLIETKSILNFKEFKKMYLGNWKYASIQLDITRNGEIIYSRVTFRHGKTTEKAGPQRTLVQRIRKAQGQEAGPA